MIHVICLTKDSNIKYLELSGHASGNHENEVICAAVSCLTRTVCEITTRLNGVISECNAPEPGSLILKINKIDKSIQERFYGITDFLLIGIIGIVKDYPESITLKINNKEWYDGSQKRWW